MSPLYLASLKLISTQALVFNACAPYQDEPEHPVTILEDRITLSVSGMTCNKCKNTIETKLMSKAGIFSATAKPKTASKNLKVSFDPEKISLEEIKDTVRGLGFKVI